MRQSIRGHQLPESPEDYKQLDDACELRFDRCLKCDSPFSAENTKSAAGWRDTQIVGFCEECYDDLFDPDIHS
jgi:hypothetical protein